MRILILANGRPNLIYMNYLFPLATLKQIVAMFFSVNVEGLCDSEPELVRFVLNRDAKYLPPRYRFFVYYNTTGKSRFAGLSVRLQVSENFQSFGKPALMTEISYPPFGYLLCLDSPPPDERLFEITHFASYDYNEFKVMNLKLPVLPTHLAYPGDYRTKDEILEQAAKSKQASTNGT